MPILTLKLSNNLTDFPFNEFAPTAHQLLSTYAKIEKCKTKLEISDTFYVGADNVDKGFAYLEILLLPRPDEMLKEIGQKFFALLNQYITPLAEKQDIKALVNVEIRLLQNYWQP